MEKELIEKLIALGWKWGYVSGHGDSEAAISGDFVIADLEKQSVLIPPDIMFKEPISIKEYFGY